MTSRRFTSWVGETYEQTQPWSLRSMSALSFDACCQDDRADLLVT